MKDSSGCLTSAVLIIGNEILSGRTQDANLSMIARKLLAVGIRVAEARVVRDREEEIVGAVNDLRMRYSYVFTTGGIGPTHDDITAMSIAKAFGLPFVLNEDALNALKSWYSTAEMNIERLQMAMMPEGAELIDNPISGVPGFRIGNVFVLAGIPEVASAMMENVTSKLRHGPKIYTATVISSVREGIIAGKLSEIAARFPNLEIGSYPSLGPGKMAVEFVICGHDEESVKEAAKAVAAAVKRCEEELT